MRIEQFDDAIARALEMRGEQLAGLDRTTQEFQLEPQADGEVLLKFATVPGIPAADHCYYCNTTWDICSST